MLYSKINTQSQIIVVLWRSKFEERSRTGNKSDSIFAYVIILYIVVIICLLGVFMTPNRKPDHAKLDLYHFALKVMHISVMK